MGFYSRAMDKPELQIIGRLFFAYLMIAAIALGAAVYAIVRVRRHLRRRRAHRRNRRR
ncbi:MAG: hypothetical protein ACTHMG_15350 [Sphingomonas sp.]